jgi:hypothetical protein
VIIEMFEFFGDLGEDKDVAARLREEKIHPCIAKVENITLDFESVTLVTQSFVQALISNVLRIQGEAA